MNYSCFSLKKTLTKRRLNTWCLANSLLFESYKYTYVIICIGICLQSLKLHELYYSLD